MDSTSSLLFLATGGYDHTIKLWQAHTGNCLRTMRFEERSQVNSLDRTPDKLKLAACGYQCVQLFDLASSTSSPLVNFEGIQKNVTRLGFQSDGKWMFTAGEDHRLRIWDMTGAPPSCMRTFDCKSPVNSACLHPNQVEIAIATQHGNVFLWDIKTDKFDSLMPQFGASVLDLAISPNGQLLAAVTNKGKCYIWPLSGAPNQSLCVLRPKHELTVHQRYVLRCKFSPDSRLLATTGSDGMVRVWRTEDFKLYREIPMTRHGWIWDAAFSADSKYLFAASSDGFARLWNLYTKALERQYSGHIKAITALCFKDQLMSQ